MSIDLQLEKQLKSKWSQSNNENELWALFVVDPDSGGIDFILFFSQIFFKK